jgi:DNA-binding MarR family transcriptional regulator
VLRSEDDLQLLAELAGVLDETVTAAGLSAGSYLVLRELVAHPGPNAVTDLAARLSADPDEIAPLCARLIDLRMAEVRGSGVEVTDAGLGRAARLEQDANEAMRAYVVERPHTATVYGLVAAMQSGRFTVEDLLSFLAEGPTADDGED